MQIVYAVMLLWDYDDGELVGIFDNKSDAETYASKQKADEVRIEEWPINSTCGIDVPIVTVISKR